jgi:hypothetical protein
MPIPKRVSKMDDSKIKETSEIKYHKTKDDNEANKTGQQYKEEITSEYDCNKHCRSCPFPGAKCVNNSEAWEYIK